MITSRRKVLDLDFFQDMEKELRDELSYSTYPKSIKKNGFIYVDGNENDYLSFVITGQLRVYSQGLNGNAITYYRLTPGDCCILTASFLFSKKNPALLIQAEADTELAVIDSGHIKSWITKYPQLNQKIHSLLTEKMHLISEKLNRIAFCTIECRVAAILKERFSPGTTIKITHQEIALEIGSAREVVSRALKNFENEGIIEILRGEIRIKSSDKIHDKINLCE